MSDDTPSLQFIIDLWSDRYGGRFPTSIRRPALDELIQDFVSSGYDRGQIERSKVKIVEEMVGPRSPFGVSALKEWKIKASKDFDKAIRASFEHFKERTGPTEIPFTLKVLTEEEELEIERQELAELQELNSLKSDQSPDKVGHKSKYEKPDYSHYEPVLRPELHPSVREDASPSPIMSDEEFFAVLERQKND